MYKKANNTLTVANAKLRFKARY